MNKSYVPVKNLIVDMDGVLWHGERPVPGLRDFFYKVDALDLNIVLATNNATKLAEDYVNKLKGFGVDIEPCKILNSAEATAAYLAHHYSPDSVAYIVGEASISSAMTHHGFHILMPGHIIGTELRADVVVAGLTRSVCYQQLAEAAYLINHGASFIGTNPDVTFPSEYGNMPGAGAILAFIEAATGQKPYIVGKPNQSMFDQALEKVNGTKFDTIMIGDRLSTDIVGAKNAGLRAVLLMSGVTRAEDLKAADQLPDWIYKDLADLTQALGNEIGISGK